MALSTETQSWLEALAKEGNLSAELLTQLRTAAEANPKADEFLKGSVLRQNDYSRQMAEVQKAKAAAEAAAAEVAAKDAAVAKYQTDLAGWKAGADKSLEAALKAKEAAEAKLLRASSKLQAVAVRYGVAEDEIKLEDGQPVEQTKPQFDDSLYARKDDIAKGVRDAALLDATIHDLDVEHQELFGKRIANSQSLVQEALASGKTLRSYWEEKFKVNDRRGEIAENNIKARIDEAVKANEAKILSAAGLPHATPGLRTDLNGSPVLSHAAETVKQNGQTPIGGGISAALAAFQSGKYKANIPGRT